MFMLTMSRVCEVLCVVVYNYSLFVLYIMIAF